MIWGGTDVTITEIKCTIDVNVLESSWKLPTATTPALPLHPWKMCLPWNWSLRPKRLGTAALEDGKWDFAGSGLQLIMSRFYHIEIFKCITHIHTLLKYFVHLSWFTPILIVLGKSCPKQYSFSTQFKNYWQLTVYTNVFPRQSDARNLFELC